MLLSSLPDAARKLDPRVMVRNPVMFVVEVGAVFSTIAAVTSPSTFAWSVVVWLWLTVVFANLAEAVAEGRGKAQAATLRARQDRHDRAPPHAVRCHRGRLGRPSSASGDRVVVVAGEVIPGDGDVVEGIASVDESAITGESAPVIREAGGDRCSVTGGTKVMSDRIVVTITAKPGESFIDRMIALVEGASRQKTPNEIALNILLASLTIVFLAATATLQPFAVYSGAEQSVVVLVALLVCLIPTTIGALLSAIGIAGMDRLVQHNVLAMSGRAVEAAGDVNTLLLDKTGTITLGNRQAAELIPVAGVSPSILADAAQLSSLADETPEGRSIVVLAKREHGLRERSPGELAGADFVPFTAQTRMSGVDLGDRLIRKGAASAVMKWVRDNGGHPTGEVGELVDAIATSGGTPLVVAEKVGDQPATALGVVHLKDVIKDGIRERFDEMRRMGIRTVMITGDNPQTARAIADRGRGRRLPRRGHPRGQDGPHQARAGGRPAGRHDRRRHQRRPRPRPGRRRGRDEHRHVVGQGGRQHGRPRLQPDQAHRDRRDRQAAPHHPRLADDVLDRQRRGQVLRDHPGDVRRRLPGARPAQRHAPREPAVGDPLGRRLQRAHHHRADPARAARRSLHAVRRAARCSDATWPSTASAASSPPSSGSSSSTSSSPQFPGIG